MFSFTSIQSYHRYLTTQPNGCEIAVAHYLASIEQNKILNCFVEVFAEEALKTAKLLDEKRASGSTPKKLHGVVIALKDVICFKDHKVTAASAILKDFVSMYTASAVQFLLDEEAIIIGNCNCDEFAMGSSNENSAYGTVLNPLDHSKVPGGSSGGSAVAVKANLCMVSLGSDTGGSVRQPADFCGLVGLKPGYGTISRYGLIAYASSFDQIGIFSKSIDDAALLLEVLGQADVYDSTMNQLSIHSTISKEILPSPRKYKLGYFKQMVAHPSLDNEIASAILQTIHECKTDGHDVDELDFDLIDFIVPAYYVLTTAEASSNLARYDGIKYGHRSHLPTQDLNDFYLHNRSEGFGKEVKRRIMLGTFVLSAGYYEAYFNKAQQVRKKLVDLFSSIFEKYDAIILPTSPTTAFPLGQKEKNPVSTYLADIFTVTANLTGLPAISIPLYKHSNGMPFGLQLLSKKQAEATLLQLSSFFMMQKEKSEN